jgi:hypothetical protein
MIPRNTWVQLLNEQQREYVYLNNGMASGLKFKNVQRIRFSNSGTHYLEMKDGKKVIVNPGWVLISIDADEWSLL